MTVRRFVATIATFTAASVLVWSVPASAGIIVTVGKQGAEASQADTHLDDCPIAGRMVAADDPNGVPPRLTQPGTAEKKAHGSLSDMDTTPEGMQCHTIGGGIQMCEPLGEAGGALGADGIETMGCSGGAAGGALAWMALGLMGFFSALRRRR